MGKKSSAPPAPDYTAAAQNTANVNRQNALLATNANRFGEVGPTGTVGWSLRPGADASNPQPGDYVRTTQLSGGQGQLLGQSEALGDQFGDYAQAGLASFQPDTVARDRLVDSLYKRNTQFYDRRFGAEEGSLETKLLNSGLARGSEAYNRAMADFTERKDSAYADASDRAVISGEQQLQANQSNEWNRLLSALSATRGGLVMPQSSNDASMPFVQGPDYTEAAGQQYDAAVQANNVNNANRAAPWNTVASLAAAYLTGGGSLVAQAAAQRAAQARQPAQYTRTS